MKTVTTRIPDEDEKLLAEFETELGTDREEVLRHVIRQGLTDWRKEKALDKLRDHSVTIRKAAEIAGVSYVEMLSIASEERIAIGHTTSDLKRDIERL